jgi:hypothetical protein
MMRGFNMKESNSRIALFKEAIALENQRSLILAKLEPLEKRLEAIARELGAGAGRPVAASPSRVASPVPRKGKNGSKRGELTAAILGALKAAGSTGVRVQEMSERFGVHVRNLFVWFSTTGRKFKNIKKVAPGRYRMVGGA